MIRRLLFATANYFVSMPLRLFTVLSLLNFLIVSLFGVLMRAKVVFEMPLLVQKHLQLAHAFFAFNGWVSFTLLWLLSDWLIQRGSKKVAHWKLMCIGQYVLSWLLLTVYLLTGMSYWSFLAETIMLSWLFYWSLVFILENRRISAYSPASAWFYPAFAFLVLSGSGTLMLFWHYMHRSLSMQTYLGGFYSFLHFQYNGWFLFGALTLLQQHLARAWTANFGIQPLAGLALPGVLLSLLWFPLPNWLFIAAVLVAVAQLYFWLQWINENRISLRNIYLTSTRPTGILLVVAAISVTARMLFQLLSTIPTLEKAAFSFRPIVIAYLHLVLLGIFSSFLLFWLFRIKAIPATALGRQSIKIFLAGFILTELVLAIQGLASFSYTQLPFASETLLLISLFFPISIIGLILVVIQRKPVHQEPHLLPSPQ